MADRVMVDSGGGKLVTALAYRAAVDARIGATFVFAHGAGAGQSSRFIVRYATALASLGLDVLTFNFLYTEAGRHVPDRTDKLEACYRAVVAAARDDARWSGNALVIGGKSMGGRIASHLAAGGEPALAGLIALGYPLHPPGKPDQLRDAHLGAIRVPFLVVQGARDPFGTPDELRPIVDRLAAPVTLHIVQDGDHSLAPPKKSALSVEQVDQQVQDVIVRWVKSLARPD